MPRKLRALLAMAVFVGLPLGGLVFVWAYAHSNIEKSAEAVGKQMVLDSLKASSSQTLTEIATFNLRESPTVKDFPRTAGRMGTLKSIDSWKTTGSSVGERGDTVWQLVHFRGTATFERGRASLVVDLGRRTINKEWLIDKIDLEDCQVSNTR